jgi:transcriptional regulator with XRE-family HTH domain
MKLRVHAPILTDVILNVNTVVRRVERLITPVTSIASRLKEAREARDLTQPALAKRAGVSQGTVGNIESGTRQGSAVVLHKLAAALSVRFEWLLEGDGPRDLSGGGGYSPEALGIAEGIDQAVHTLRDPGALHRIVAKLEVRLQELIAIEKVNAMGAPPSSAQPNASPTEEPAPVPRRRREDVQNQT